jgi:hypothetical protein
MVAIPYFGAKLRQMNTDKLREEENSLGHKNEYFAELYHYKDSEVYKEIVLFLNGFEPEWRKNKELGEWAPEFCLHYINLYEDALSDRKNQSFADWARGLSKEISKHYSRAKEGYQSARETGLINSFHDFLERKYGQEEVDDDVYEEEYARYCKEDNEKIALTF